jgi:hypothetical protein
MAKQHGGPQISFMALGKALDAVKSETFRRMPSRKSVVVKAVRWQRAVAGRCRNAAWRIAEEI